ncbi:MAG: bis(5'-nucleosyl)-tetraphosphatase (symmetrical) YqeK [Raoultibacter sp.]|jgi:predicted HD superfamily hydrolase involved in NAD metabolism
MDYDVLSDEFFEQMRNRVQQRLRKQRFEHVESVAQTAITIAKEYGLDWRRARLAAILHDWDKDISDEAIIKRAKELGVVTDAYVMDTMPRLLHGLTAAAALKREYPEIPQDVLDAVAYHTSACIGMTELDMVVYIADVIEPLRPFPATQKLRDKVGKISLEDLFLRTFKQVFSNLIESNYRVHPSTVDVWNYYLVRARERKRNRKKGLL